MALEMRPLSEGTGHVELVTVTCHWYLTEDRARVVPEGHADARWLWAAPGDEVLRSDAEKLGALASAKTDNADEADRGDDGKRRDAPDDKRRARPADKGGR